MAEEPDKTYLRKTLPARRIQELTSTSVARTVAKENTVEAIADRQIQMDG